LLTPEELLIVHDSENYTLMCVTRVFTKDKIKDYYSKIMFFDSNLQLKKYKDSMQNFELNYLIALRYLERKTLVRIIEVLINIHK